MAAEDWYKDAIFYELNVKAFQDSNGDGIGDLQGLISKLDYLKDLGVDCLWLLPIYPSPGRDDGYDIQDYNQIHQDYGTMEDFKEFLQEAHMRGIKVIADLVLNHTSDQHPWFVEAAKGPDNPFHDYYVWSDTWDKYTEARIIFVDTESSNWTWHDGCKRYYWHRFFSHQPDLNFDNPKVREEIINVVRFWLDLGLDGFRADAVPYLFEREGTNCENLPETHDYLKQIRKVMGEEYPGTILLAEANQWPADLIPYFGDGDEFHMAFHFPIMPRMFMALKLEHHGPIVDIIKQTPRIPENCQWAIFLRNHDELTLEMCTDEERDYMYKTYAENPKMKINVGIRRRLMPLLDRDFRRYELLNALLFCIPGSPVLYYGDEIGMGDNIYLGDRNGVRTPMQWNDNRNGGFSRANPSMLYAPVITDPTYSYYGVNVEQQVNVPSSTLNFTKELIRFRKGNPVLARGDLHFRYPENKKILVFLREDGEHSLLCVFNMASTTQPVEIDLSEYAGMVPREVFGGTDFPPIGDLPYFLTLARHSFYVFRLLSPEEAPVEAPRENEWISDSEENEENSQDTQVASEQEIFRDGK
jgi:maltose alpha-D-glucosyltransferase/alpha-amylase